MKARRAGFYAFVIAIVALIIFAVAEAGTRAALTRARSPLRAISPSLGWETAANVRLRYTHPAFGDISMSTGPRGFRRFDDTTVARTRMLVIGDSFTEAAQVSDGEAFFDHVARLSPGTAIFAHGTGGYGTLQEFLILDREIDSIRPDLILWQLSANDFVNNDHFLETQSPLSSRMTRPYYENGKFEHRFAGSGAASRYSRLVRFVDARIAMLRGHGFQAAGLDTEREKRPDALRRSIRTTSELMGMAHARAGQTPIVAFLAEGDAFADSVFRELTSANGWQMIPGVIDSVAAASAAGVKVDGLPRDGHWNAAGHAIAGRVIARRLDSLLLSLRKED